jgi:hypothetical protein
MGIIKNIESNGAPILNSDPNKSLILSIMDGINAKKIMAYNHLELIIEGLFLTIAFKLMNK